MRSTFDKLARILTMEREQGCPDRVVIGGLGKFLPFWIKEAQSAAQSAELSELVHTIASLLEGYGQQERTSRAQAVAQALQALARAQELCASVAASALEQPLREQSPEPHSPSRPSAASRNAPPPSLEQPVTSLAGVSATYARRLERLNIRTVRDLLFHLPRRYDDYSRLKRIDQLRYGEEVTLVGTVWDTKTRQARNGLHITTCIVADRSGTIEVTWFNQPYLASRLRPGREIVLSGRVEEYLGRLTFQSPTWEPLEREQLHTGRLVPVYPLTEGISDRWLRRLIKTTLDGYVSQVADPLPAALRSQEGLLDLAAALRAVHFPRNQAEIDQARRRLCFEEFLLVQLGVLRKRHAWRSRSGRPAPPSPAVEQFFAGLPFRLTAAQERSWQQISADLAKATPMSRLLQGDVGSGKTVVAVAAMLQVVASGQQAALMAPTEILAAQHFDTICRLIDELTLARGGGREEPVRVALLTGSLRAREKAEIREAIAAGELDIVVGTHALIQEGVQFRQLGLVIVDEQHRFGVQQRASLRQKGDSEVVPHLLVMTATPIPRTLALTIYGDLDLSVIDELPPNRQRVITHLIAPRERERAYQFVRAQVEKGHQAFIICPLIEETDKMEAKAATEEYERLQEEVFPDLRLALLHGRMKADEKDAVIGAFRNGEYDILVSTAVVEVGIDVPNATVMLIEGANRFGLAQLHQFRGRVGRGEAQSYCLLISDSSAQEAMDRLAIVAKTHDGFALAEEDLRLRGPGEFFGTRQSGLPDLKVATLSDGRILEDARRVARTLFESDPDLAQPAHAALRERVLSFWSEEAEPN
ncbi:MAG: ATP-dependent DNA helicase RecG [Anaerolineae bacterium]|nr:ATP-dependent DNA helicase RecG [Anaerolineae bacterium]